MKIHCVLVQLFVSAALVMNVSAAEPKAPDKKDGKDAKKPAEKKIFDKMDYGPFLTASIISEPTGKFKNDDGSWSCDVTPRGIAIRLEEGFNTGMVFDCDAMRFSAGWTGKPLKMAGLIGDGAHGPGPTINTPPVFQTPYGPGWADKTGSFKDPRPDSINPLPPPGRLPTEWAKYKGLYRHGDQVVLSYTVGSAAVLDMPGLESNDALKVFTRTIRVAESPDAMGIMVAAVKDGTGAVDGETATLGALHAGLVDAPAGAKFEVAEGQLHLRIPAHTAVLTFKLLLSGGGDAAKGAFADLLKASPKPTDLTALIKGGPSKWAQTLETKGVVAKGDEAYVIDSLTIPYENPYNAWMRTAAFDFFSDGTRAAVSTWSGDVWIVSGIDEGLEHLQWKRFATGLHQPLGLKIVDDVVYTVGHDQITRLRDLDGDGEADFYECFNNDWELTSAFHAFAFDLNTDPEGNFIFAFGSPVHAGGGGFQKITKHHGCVLKVSKDGSKMDVVACGLRAPNGMGMSPTGQITSGDNEGSWVPSSPLHWIKPGMFLGVSDSAHGLKVEQPKPLLWLPHNSGIDNSCGGQAWVTSDKWGPFKGELLHMSYGQSSLFLVMKEQLEGQMQGGAVKIPVKFTSSTMRARFNQKDGQLYICGLRGWQTNAVKDGGLDRVRYTGNKVYLPSEFHVLKNGVSIAFTQPVDPASAKDIQNYSVECWNYHWTSSYGSKEYSTLPETPAVAPKPDEKPVDPKAKPKEKPKAKDVHDTLNVKSASVSADGKIVFLEIPDIRPCMQMKINCKIKAADEKPLSAVIHNTIYNLGTQGVPGQ